MEWHILFDDPLSALVTSFPALVTLFLNTLFTSEKAAGAINKETIGANKETRNPTFLFHGLLISCFFYYV